MTEEKVILKIKEIMVCNPYRGTYVMRKENIPFLAADLVKLFAIPDVNNQRELLIAFLFDFVGGDEQTPIDEWADSFLERNKGNL